MAEFAGFTQKEEIQYIKYLSNRVELGEKSNYWR
jgi:hypothetical protein